MKPIHPNENWTPYFGITPVEYLYPFLFQSILSEILSEERLKSPAIDRYIPEGVVVEMFCPACGGSLKVEHEKCDFCFSPMFALYLPNGGILEGCLKSGCHQHKLVLVDVHEQLGKIHGQDQIQLLM